MRDPRQLIECGRRELVDWCQSIGGDATCADGRRRDAVHPYAIFKVDCRWAHCPGDHPNLVAPTRHRWSKVADESSNSARDVRRETARHNREFAPPRLVERWERREVWGWPRNWPEPQAMSLAAESGALDQCRGAGLLRREYRARGQAPRLLVSCDVVNTRCDERFGMIVNVVFGIRIERVSVREVHLVLHDRIPVCDHPLVITNARRQELVMHRGIGKLAQHETRIHEPTTHVGFVEVIVERLIETADMQQRLAPEQSVGSLQIGELKRTGKALTIERFAVTYSDLGEAIGRAVSVLQREAGVIKHDATNTRDFVVVKRRQRLLQPVVLG